MTPKLSIVIVNYHSADALEHCLRSLHVATDAAVELIVVDNSPQEKTKAIIAASQFHGHYVPQPTNVGFAAAANVGISLAAGEYVCVVHPDIIFDTHTLDRLVAWVEQHPRTIVGPRVRDAHNQIMTTAFPFMTRRAIMAAHHPTEIWPRSWHPLLPWLVPEFRYAWQCRSATEPLHVPVLGADCLVMARTVWEEVGPFNEELNHFGLESEWFHRARELGCTAWYIPEAVIFHEHRTSTTSVDTWHAHEGKDRARRWHAKQLGLIALGLLAIALWIERRFEARPR